MLYEIGTEFLSGGKSPRLCTVSDIWTTTDHLGNIVHVRYVATHEFMGQTVTERDICAVTIAKGIAALRA